MRQARIVGREGVHVCGLGISLVRILNHPMARSPSCVGPSCHTGSGPWLPARREYCPPCASSASSRRSGRVTAVAGAGAASHAALLVCGRRALLPQPSCRAAPPTQMRQEGSPHLWRVAPPSFRNRQRVHAGRHASSAAMGARFIPFSLPSSTGSRAYLQENV
jgi:hypothetical protein